MVANRSFIIASSILVFSSVLLIAQTNFPVTLGHRIPQPDMISDYAKGCLWAFSLSVSIFLLPIPAKHKLWLSLAWAIKVFIALAFMLIYENHYGLDAYSYFRNAKTGIFSLSSFSFGFGTHNLTNLARFQNQFIPDSYHALKISCAFIGLLAIYLFYKAAVMYLEGRDNDKLFFVLALFPGVLFWSTILGKDPIVLFGIAIYCLGAVGWQKKRRLLYLVLICLGIAIAAFIRVWLAPILVAPLAVYVFFGIKNYAVKTLFLIFVALLFLVSMDRFTEKFQVETVQEVVQTTEKVSQGWARGGSGQSREGDIKSVGDMIKFAPIGMVTALFRPFPGEVLNLFGLLASLENLILLYLFILSIKRFRKGDLKDPVLLWAIVLVLTWSFVYGFVSFQNLGSAVRFKLQVLPILICILLYLSRKRKLRRTFIKQ